jgi:hypothetical protein
VPELPDDPTPEQVDAWIELAGLAPDSPEAAAVVDELLPAYGGDADRVQLADRLATGTDARAERYWQLLAIINGWPPVPTTVPAWEWLIAALRV